jgi:hypothetical protein
MSLIFSISLHFTSLISTSTPCSSLFDLAAQRVIIECSACHEFHRRKRWADQQWRAQDPYANVLEATQDKTRRLLYEASDPSELRYALPPAEVKAWKAAVENRIHLERFVRYIGFTCEFGGSEAGLRYSLEHENITPINPAAGSLVACVLLGKDKSSQSFMGFAPP